jgi:endonuclease/exonuclease/phosphatase family metal-dependent hydrolase
MMTVVIKFIPAIIACLITVGILYIALVIGYAAITAFSPDQIETLMIDNRGKDVVPTGQEISLITWNIGYAGLGKEMDFFYEGGKQVRPVRQLHEKYINGIVSYIRSNTDTDFFLLQEVDFYAKRSYKSNQHSLLADILPGFSSTSAINYQSGFVPVPLNKPMGVVYSGLSMFSSFNMKEATRIATPGGYTWPKRLFMMKRCFLVSRFTTDTGLDLVVVNVHNSAFADEKELRALELSHLRNLAIKEFEKGSYVIAGGDWNQNPPGMDPDKIRNDNAEERWPISQDYFPAGWTWVFDPALPTNRGVDKPYDPEHSSSTIIDYFLVSPNIEVSEVQTTDLQFGHSDHNPVRLRVSLKP